MTNVEILLPKILKQLGEDEYGYITLPSVEVLANYTPEKKTFLNYLFPNYEHPITYTPGQLWANETSFTDRYSQLWNSMHDGKDHKIYEAARSGLDDVAKAIYFVMASAYGGQAGALLTGLIMKAGLGPKVAALIASTTGGVGEAYALDKVDDLDKGHIGRTDIPFIPIENYNKMSVSELEALRDRLDDALHGTTFKKEASRAGAAIGLGAVPWADKIWGAIRKNASKIKGTPWRVAGSIAASLGSELLGRDFGQRDDEGERYLEAIKLLITYKQTQQNDNTSDLFNLMIGNTASGLRVVDTPPPGYVLSPIEGNKWYNPKTKGDTVTVSAPPTQVTTNTDSAKTSTELELEEMGYYENYNNQ